MGSRPTFKEGIMNEPKTAYPLSWPVGWRRTQRQYRQRSNFSKARNALSVAEGTKRVLDELRRFGVPDYKVILSTNIQVRLDGLPYSNQKEPQDPGVAIYWKRQGKDQVMATDTYDRVADNLAAIAASLEAIRAIERHGGSQIMDRAFLGFTALPAPEQWRDVLEMPQDAPTHKTVREVARDHYMRLAKKHHPDNGGNAEQMARINRAWSDAQRELGA